MIYLRPLFYLLLITSCLAFISCTTESAQETSNETTTAAESKTNFDWQVDRFDDKRVLRYKINGFEKLSLQQQEYVYYLTQAGLYGRDMMFDMNYRHNLEIKGAFDKILSATYGKIEEDSDWNAFLEYAKNFYFSNGIHHHYSMEKFQPGFSKTYFETLSQKHNVELSVEAMRSIFDAEFDSKKVSLDPSKDLLQTSAVNFYAPELNQKEVEAFYKSIKSDNEENPISYSLNSRLTKNNGKVEEEKWKVGGLYGKSLVEVCKWLKKASEVAENDSQKEALGLLIAYYETGDLKIWDDYNIKWAGSTDGDVDYINGFVEVYNDPLGYKGSYEMIVQIKDFDASERMAKVAEHAKYFEDNSPIMEEHKKKDVVGISYNVVTVAGEAGDASPATPIGVNLPNANWIRAKHGSKSVSLGNIIEAYDKAEGNGLLGEFAHDKDEKNRVREFGGIADKMGTALHEVIGHASGQLEPGVATPKETLKSFYSTLEEARADLVALYYITDPILVEWGLLPTVEAGKAEYDSYLRNGLMTQLMRINEGKEIEESHMRNRQLISKWVFERGLENEAVKMIEKDGKHFIEIIDYMKLRSLFGELLKEVQRIKSQGDYEGGKALVENYGIKVDENIHLEVLQRTKALNIAPYSGFVNPVIKPVLNEDGKIEKFNIEYKGDFIDQMLDYSTKYTTL